MGLFSRRSKSLVGLDIGSSAVKAVELRSTLRGLDPVQMRVHPRADPDAPLSELLARFIRMHQLPTDLVVAALPGSRLSVRRMEFPFREAGYQFYAADRASRAS